MHPRLETRPASVRKATIAMLAGLACSLVLAVAVFLDQTVFGGIEDRIWDAYPNYTQAETDSEVTAVVIYLWVLAGLAAACWSWMTVATLRRWRGTRVASTVLLVLGLCVAGANGYVPMPAWLTLCVWLHCAAGAAAVGLLWTRESRGHFPAGRSDQRRAQAPARS